ncbi:UNVERIFIED_CONTAM: hypothetical protein Scaly_3022900 [Sesamum calycinum]|uniref:DUF4283 domain-containing protein n=1 Tax=Sesamum calycinum TaxID=2727403 RepID=A0AAW2K9H6_9LAMI
MVLYSCWLLSGKETVLSPIRKFARTNWKGLQHVSASSSGFFFFDSTVGWPWKMLLKGALGCSKVSPLFFSPGSRACPCDGKKHTQIPVWIRLKHLPMEYWTDEGLSTVASGVGTPLYADGITKACSRLDYARVCVMLNFDSELPKHLVVISPVLRNGKEDPKRIDVEYEWLPQRCKIVVLWGMWLLLVRPLLRGIQHRRFQYLSKNRVLNRTLLGLNRALDRKWPLSLFLAAGHLALTRARILFFIILIVL